MLAQSAGIRTESGILMSSPALLEDRSCELLPHDRLGQRLTTLFPYHWQAIAALNEPKPSWETITKYPVRSRVLWHRWQDPTQLVGVRFGSATWYALIDIDSLSPYHPRQNAEALRMLRSALETIGIYRTVLVQSSSSGGLHLYIPFPMMLPTFGVATALKQCLEAQGMTIVPGTLEIFPNTKAYAKPGEYSEYNAHRLPLQPSSGSWLLDDEGNPISTDLGRFFQAWDMAAAGQVIEEVRSAISVAKLNRRRRRRSLGVVEEWRSDLQTEMAEGWTGYGQTNQLLKTIACYGVVFEGLTDEALAEFVQTTAMNAPGYSDYCRHRHEIGVRSIVWARSAQKYWWALGSNPKRTRTTSESNQISLNQLRAEDAQRRIREGVDRLVEDGQFPVDATARVRVLIREVRTSSQTLYRYRELWHPEHRESDRTRCVMVEAAGNAECSVEEISQDPELPESRQSEELHTLREGMKGGRGFDGDRMIEAVVDEAGSETVMEFKSSDRNEDESIEKRLEKSVSTIEVIQEATELSGFQYSLLLMHDCGLEITVGNRNRYSKNNEKLALSFHPFIKKCVNSLSSV
jgi:hypothetical protein